MTFIPKGSLAFSGYGASPMKFLSPAGVDLGVRASAQVNPGAGCDAIMVLKGSNRIVTIGGGPPNFPTTGIGIFNPDFTIYAEGHYPSTNSPALALGEMMPADFMALGMAAVPSGCFIDTQATAPRSTSGRSGPRSQPGLSTTCP